MPVRELSIAPREAVFPQWIDGVQHWISPEVQEFTDKLHNGDATLGWQGDPRLALYFNPQESRWYIYRMEADEVLRPFCRSAPGQKLDNSVFLNLVAHDTRNGFDPVAYMAEQGKVLDKQEDDAAAVLAEVSDKVVHALAKSNGIV